MTKLNMLKLIFISSKGLDNGLECTSNISLKRQLVKGIVAQPL